MITYWVLFGIATIVAIVAVYFFIIGLLDGTVSSRNMLMWLGLLSVVMGVIFGGLWLKSSGNLVAAKILLCVLAVPGIIAGLFILIAIIGKPRWN
ncbi:MAG: osmoprotectant transporter permease [Bacteroidia bacterium]|nr:osmoprotectant transporter permease [Bacteroidia bacterium]